MNFLERNDSFSRESMLRKLTLLNQNPEKRQFQTHLLWSFDLFWSIARRLKKSVDLRIWPRRSHWYWSYIHQLSYKRFSEFHVSPPASVILQNRWRKKPWLLRHFNGSCPNKPSNLRTFIAATSSIFLQLWSFVSLFHVDCPQLQMFELPSSELTWLAGKSPFFFNRRYIFKWLSNSIAMFVFGGVWLDRITHLYKLVSCMFIWARV